MGFGGAGFGGCTDSFGSSFLSAFTSGGGGGGGTAVFGGSAGFGGGAGGLGLLAAGRAAEALGTDATRFTLITPGSADGVAARERRDDGHQQQQDVGAHGDRDRAPEQALALFSRL